MANSVCPICRKSVKIPGDQEPMGNYPFCSERCKVIDLGRWLDGRYQVPVVEENGDTDLADGGDNEMEDDDKP